MDPDERLPERRQAGQVGAELIERDQRELSWLNDRGLFDSNQGRALRDKIETAGHRMTELRLSGRTPNVAGRWEEIS